eukprot:scaffold128380_cov33-Phaeocystis_antarctica.AAC.1
MWSDEASARCRRCSSLPRRACEAVPSCEPSTRTCPPSQSCVPLDTYSSRMSASSVIRLAASRTASGGGGLGGGAPKTS